MPKRKSRFEYTIVPGKEDPGDSDLVFISIDGNARPFTFAEVVEMKDLLVKIYEEMGG